MKILQRRRVLVDLKLQGVLCYRVAVYWICCLMCVGLFLGWGTAFDGAYDSSRQWLERFWQESGAVIILPLLFLPFVMLDCLIWSNTFAGPFMRLRRAMRNVADGKTGETIRLRRGDYLKDVVEDYNRIVARLQEYEAKERQYYSAFEGSDDDAIDHDSAGTTSVGVN